MRSFASILVLFAMSLLTAAVLAYPFWLLVGLIDGQPIHRVMHRVAMLCALIGLIWLFRRWKLANRNAAGFGLPRREFWRQLAAGLIAGALVIAPLLVTLLLVDVRVADERVAVTGGLVARMIGKGLLAGMAVALIEEVFFRGVLYTAIERESGRLAAVVLPSLLYAAVHFLDGRLRVPADQIEWSSGLTVFSRMFLAYAEPLRIADSFLALFAVGVLLALVRTRTGAIAACMGLHAAWVCALYSFEVTTQVDRTSNAAWMVGSYDGVIGWAAVAWMLGMAALYAAVSRRTTASAN